MRVVSVLVMVMGGLWSQVALAQEYLAFPATLRDTEERLTVRFGVGITPTFGTTSMEGNGGGGPLNEPGMRSGNTLLEGTLAVGTRRILLPTLNTYALMQGVMDARGAPMVISPDFLEGDEQVSLQPSLYHEFNGARAFLFHLGYAELDGFSKEGLLSGLFLRAGRQFHFGAAPVTFDGGTLGFSQGGFSIDVRGGQRSGIFDTTSDDFDEQDRGFLAGGRVGYDYRSGGLKFGFSAEYLYFSRTLGLLERDRVREGVETVELTSNLGDVKLYWSPSPNIDLVARASFALPELSRIHVSGLLALGRTVVTLEFTQRVGRDVLYDLAAGQGFRRAERERNYESLRLNIPNLKPYSEVRASVLFDVSSWLEIGPAFGGRLVHADSTERSPYDANRLTYGLVLQGRFRLSEGDGIELAGEYIGIAYDRSSDRAESTFDDVAAGGEKFVHDGYASLRYVRGRRAIAGRLLSGQSFSAGIYGYVSAGIFDSRYLDEEVTDLSAGGGFETRVGLSRFVEARVTYELLRDSDLAFTDVGAYHLIRTVLEGRF